MPDEPVEVQLERVRWEGRTNLAKAIGLILTPIALAVLAYFTADAGAEARAGRRHAEAALKQSAENMVQLKAVHAEVGAQNQETRRLLLAKSK